MSKVVYIAVKMDRTKAEALGQMIKRIGLSDLRELAKSQDEAYEMLHALVRISESLKAKGIEAQ